MEKQVYILKFVVSHSRVHGTDFSGEEINTDHFYLLLDCLHANYYSWEINIIYHSIILMVVKQALCRQYLGQD